MKKRRTQNAECRTKKETNALRAPSSFSVQRSPFSVSAFTLTEILVVIIIIVLMLAMAMPAFRYMTGSRSQESAANEISSMLARARAEAIGLQQNRGVAFYVNASTQRTMMAIVQPVTIGTWQANTFYPAGTYVTYMGSNYVAAYDVQSNSAFQGTASPPTTAAPWAAFTLNTTNNPSAFSELYDQVPDTDVEPLPAGVDVQLVNDDNGNAGKADRYLHTGVIMFDSTGKLASQSYLMSNQGLIGRATGFSLDIANNIVKTDVALSSQYGLVLYDHDAFVSQGFTSGDPELDTTLTYGTVGSSPPSEADEENWLDANATPLLINRFNGTLVQGQ